MNSALRTKIKAHCETTYPGLQERFSTIERYQRFVRRFYAIHHAMPLKSDCGKPPVVKKDRRHKRFRT